MLLIWASSLLQLGTFEIALEGLGLSGEVETTGSPSIFLSFSPSHSGCLHWVSKLFSSKWLLEQSYGVFCCFLMLITLKSSWDAIPWAFKDVFLKKCFHHILHFPNVYSMNWTAKHQRFNVPSESKECTVSSKSLKIKTVNISSPMRIHKTPQKCPLHAISFYLFSAKRWAARLKFHML